MSFLSNLLKPKTSREKAAALDLARFNLSLVGEAQAHIDDIQNELGMNEAERNAFWQSNYSPIVYASIKACKAAKAPLTKTKHGFLTSTPASTPANKPANKPVSRTVAIKPTAIINPLAAATDRYIIQMATHRSSSEADKIAARSELQRREINLTKEGIRSRSTKGGRAVRVTTNK